MIFCSAPLFCFKQQGIFVTLYAQDISLKQNNISQRNRSVTVEISSINFPCTVIVITQQSFLHKDNI